MTTKHTLPNIPEDLVEIMARITSVTCQPCYLVGGAVRDLILGTPVKDWDVEVYGITFERLTLLLKSHGKVDLVGRSFGVLKLQTPTLTCDFSVPRRDSKISDATDSRGRGIKVVVDPTLTVKEATKRRDFTINAMLYDPVTRQLEDPFGGYADLQNKILRALDDSFTEDPLRVLRGFQFVARFGFTVDEQTLDYAQTVKDAPLVPEREAEEWKKFLLKGKYFSKAFDYLVKTKWLDRYPELKAIMHLPQDARWHAEGTVGRHTSLCMEHMNTLISYQTSLKEQQYTLMLAALVHDMGKAETTRVDEKGRIVSPGHAFSDKPEAFMKRIGTQKNIALAASRLVQQHMAIISYDEKSPKNNVLQLAEKLHPATIHEWALLVQADRGGRVATVQTDMQSVETVISNAMKARVYGSTAKDLITAADIIKVWPGVPRDKFLGEVLREVRERMLEKKFVHASQAVQFAMSQYRKRYQIIKAQDLLDLGITPGIGGTSHAVFGKILEQLWISQLDQPHCTRESLLVQLRGLIAGYYPKDIVQTVFSEKN